MSIYLRGEIFLVNFEPWIPGEANKIRPAIIVTNNIANQFNSTLMVVPLSSNVDRIYSFQLLLTAEVTRLDHDSKAQVEQMRAVSKSRFGERLGRVSDELMLELEQRIKLHLGMG